MADTKISALTSASTPLAGTEVLPIVQSGATVKVATNDLTVRNIRANATTGILQVTGPTIGTTRVMTTPDANFSVARTDAAQSFTGDQTLSTGNIIQGTAGKGFNFTANTPAAGMTSELFNWYEEGTWTLVITAASGSFGTVSGTGTYTRIGRAVYIDYNILITGNGTAAGSVKVAGLPYNASGFRGYGVGSETDAVGFSITSQVIGSTDYFFLAKFDGTYPGGNGYRLQGSFTYKV
jgi:hypothetical protein